jgi:hypothetical protein
MNEVADININNNNNLAKMSINHEDNPSLDDEDVGSPLESSEDKKPAKKGTKGSLIPTISIQVQGEYIAPDCPFVLEQLLCEMHTKLNKINIININIFALQSFIFRYIPQSKGESFNLKNIDKPKRKIYLLCFLDTMIDRITNQTTNPIDYDKEVGLMCVGVVLRMLKKNNGKNNKNINEYLNDSLRERTEQLAILLPNCSCSSTLKINTRTITSAGYKIYNRFDLVQRLMPPLDNQARCLDTITNVLGGYSKKYSGSQKHCTLEGFKRYSK